MDQITIKDVLECVGENINPAKDIIGTEAEKASTVEYILSKTYFQNLGMIMSEYLSTTTLGDLQRKSNDINISEQLEEKEPQISWLKMLEFIKQLRKLLPQHQQQKQRDRALFLP